LGETRDIRGRDAEVSQRDGDVGLGTAEACVEHRRLEQAFLARRAEPQQQLAERDDRHAGRAAATASSKARARRVSSGHAASRTTPEPTSALPTLTPAAPARIHSPAFSTDTPPDGTTRRKGRGARTSRR